MIGMKHEKEVSFIYTCLQCKKTGTTNLKNRKFCSGKCCAKFHALKNTKKQKEERKKNKSKFIYTCLQCKKTGTTNLKNRKFCSRKCCVKSNALKNTQKQKEERIKNKSIICPMCKTSFYPMRKNQILCYREECGSGYLRGSKNKSHKKHISYHSTYSNTEKVSKGSACKIVICSIIDNVRDYLFEKFGMMTRDNIEIFNHVRREYLKKYCSSTTGSRYVMGAALFHVVGNMINKSNHLSQIQAEDIKLAMMEKFGEKTSCCLATMKRKVNLIIKFIHESDMEMSKAISDDDPFGIVGFFKLKRKTKPKPKPKLIQRKSRRKSAVFTYTCLQCKKVGTTCRKNQKYCSQECRTKTNSLKRSEEPKEEEKEEEEKEQDVRIYSDEIRSCSLNQVQERIAYILPIEPPGINILDIVTKTSIEESVIRKALRALEFKGIIHNDNYRNAKRFHNYYWRETQTSRIQEY